MKILHILDHSLPIHSGYAFRTAEILKSQRAMGWYVAALTGPKHNLYAKSPIEGDGEDYVRAPFTAGFRRAPGPLKQLGVVTALRRAIFRLCEQTSFDVLHAHSPSLNGIAALSVGRRLGIPVVYEMRASWEDAAVDHGTSAYGGIRYQLTRASETRVLRRADAVVTICDGLKNEICSRGIAAEKVTVVPNAVDTRAFRPADERGAELKPRFDAAGRVVVTFCGSFYNYEGLGLLVDAVGALASSKPEILLLLAGGGEQERQLADEIRSRDLSGHVRMLGRVPQSTVNELYMMADACVFPRHRNRLTDMVTPLKPLEAMAAGGVVVASSVGGHRELVSDGETGFLFEADEINSLVQVLGRTLDAAPLTGLRKAARDFVVSNRTWKATCARYLDTYRHARAV